MGNPNPDQVLEDRIDDYAVGIFQHLGFSGRLPDNLVDLYQRVKRKKDALSPGRFKPEMFALLVVLAEKERESPVTVANEDFIVTQSAGDESDESAFKKGDEVLVNEDDGKDKKPGRVTSVDEESGVVRVAVEGDKAKYREFGFSKVSHKE